MGLKINKEQIRRILVIRLDKVGDLILSTPFLRNLRDNFRDSHICFIATPYTGEVLKGNNNVDEIRVYDQNANLKKKLNFINNIRKEKFDLAVSLSPITSSHFLSFLSGAAYRLGYVYSGRWLTRLLSGMILTDMAVLGIDELLRDGKSIPHEVEQTMNILNVSGFVTNTYALELFPGKEDMTYSDDMMKDWSDKRIIGIHLSNKWLTGKWSVKNLCSLIERTVEETQDSRLLLTYGKIEEELAENLRMIFEKEDRIRIVGNIPFMKWAALISRCGLFYSTDTGALHCACALGIPVVAVYDERNFKHCSMQWAPWKVENVIIRKAGMPDYTINEILAAKDKLLEHWRIS